MPGVHTFYDGSRLLDPLAAWTGFETDKLNLVLCQFIAIPLAVAYNLLLPPSTSNSSRHTWRLALPFVVGILLCYFCYGSAIKHILANVTVCYLLMKFAPAKHVHRVVFIFSMGYLMFIHWFRWHILSEYYIDVTGPIMIMVQKCTTLAFSLHDGRVKRPEELNEIQKREAISEVPGVLEYLSYLFAFQTALTGPLFFYTDYMHFIEGNVVVKGKQAPNPWPAAFTKLLVALCCFCLILAFGKTTQPEIIADEENLLLSWWRWWGLFYFVILMQRVKYYYAWTLADAICNFSGFGFSGYTASGEEKWDLVSNVSIWRVEMATSFKETLDAWNITTMSWLRRVAYDRVPNNYRTVSTYLLSACWHGFSAGYYITFVTGAVASRWMALCYDALTFIATKVALAYTTFPFVTMHLDPGWFIYKRLYFFVHLMALFSMLVLPRIAKPLSRSAKGKKGEGGDTKSIQKSLYSSEKRDIGVEKKEL